MVIQKPVDYVVEKLWPIYTLPLVRSIQYIHKLLCGRRDSVAQTVFSLFLALLLFLLADTWLVQSPHRTTKRGLVFENV